MRAGPGADAKGEAVIPGEMWGAWMRGIPETRVALLPSPRTGSPALKTHMIYSSLFSSVTRMLSPPSLSSWVVTLPRISMSWMKYSSRPHSSRLFSLAAQETKREEFYLRRAPSSCSVPHFSAHGIPGLTALIQSSCTGPLPEAWRGFWSCPTGKPRSCTSPQALLKPV